MFWGVMGAAKACLVVYIDARQDSKGNKGTAGFRAHRTSRNTIIGIRSNMKIGRG